MCNFFFLKNQLHYLMKFFCLIFVSLVCLGGFIGAEDLALGLEKAWLSLHIQVCRRGPSYYGEDSL